MSTNNHSNKPQSNGTRLTPIEILIIIVIIGILVAATIISVRGLVHKHNSGSGQGKVIDGEKIHLPDGESYTFPGIGGSTSSGIEFQLNCHFDAAGTDDFVSKLNDDKIVIYKWEPTSDPAQLDRFVIPTRPEADVQEGIDLVNQALEGNANCVLSA